VSGYYNESDPENEFEGSGEGKGLRKQLETALGEIQSLRKALAGDRKKEAETQLKDMGLDPAVLGLAPDGADPKEWVEKNAHLLGGKAQEAEETPPIDQPQVVAATDDDPALVAEREALAKIQEAESAGNPVVSSDLFEQMKKIDTEDELLAFFKNNGGGTADF
jgi:hypothetical protein